MSPVVHRQVSGIGHAYIHTSTYIDSQTTCIVGTVLYLRHALDLRIYIYGIPYHIIIQLCIPVPTCPEIVSCTWRVWWVYLHITVLCCAESSKYLVYTLHRYLWYTYIPTCTLHHAGCWATWLARHVRAHVL